MHMRDHDIVVEHQGMLFRACVTAAALEKLGRRGGSATSAEALIADHRAELEQIAVAALCAGGIDQPSPVLIKPADLHAPCDLDMACLDDGARRNHRLWNPPGFFRRRRHLGGS